MSQPARTRAEEVYADGYVTVEEKTGFPDRKIVEGLSAAGQKILSLGSGDCADIWFLAEQNEIYAIDSSPSAIEAATAHGIKGMVHDLEKVLPFADRTFDLVVCKDLLEHLVAPERLLKEIRRIMKPEGRLVLSIPNHLYLPFRLRILFGGNLIWRSLIHDHTKFYDEWNYMHLRFFTYTGLLKFLGQGGFAVEKGFWDFGLLAHYTNPDTYHEHLREKYRHKPPTGKARLFFRGLYPLWRLFNFLFPRQLRSAVVSLAPGLLCAGFYLRCTKKGV